MKDLSYYENYTVEDWVDDTDFARWLQTADTDDSCRLFTELIQQNEEAAKKMKIAAEILNGLRFSEPELSITDVDSMWEVITRNTIRSKTPYSIRNHKIYYGWVAVAILLIGFFSLYLWPSGTNSKLKEVASVISVDSVEDITLFVDGKPRLSLSDKVEINLFDETMRLKTYNGDKIEINNLRFSDREVASLVVPRGKKAGVVFADGTRMIIRSGTKISFPTAFADSHRNVFVEGEAFFEVSKNKHRPFIVSMPRMNVQVLGTSFDVQSYPDQQSTSVVLVTGRVKVGPTDENNVEITPGQMYSLHKEKNTAQVDRVDVYNYIGWKDGVLSFNSESLLTVLNQLSDYFGVDFEYDTIKLKDIRITGKLDLNKDLESTLKVLAEISNTRFSTMNAKIKIDVKP